MSRFTELDLQAMEARLARNRRKPILSAPIPSTPGEPARRDTSTDDEAELHNQISDWCKYRGWLCFHGSMAHRARRTPGEPDFIICTDDKRVLFVECKTKVGKLSQEQLAIQAWLKKLGHDYHIVRSLAEFMDVAKGKQ